MSAPHAASLRELRKAHEHNLSTEYKSGETDGVELTGHADAVMNVLRKHSAGEFVHGDVVEFAANTPCFDALKVMSAKHITGAPVYETIADQSQEWVRSPVYVSSVVFLLDSCVVTPTLFPCGNR